MANLGIPYDPPTNPQDRVTSFVGSQTNLILSAVVAAGSTPTAGQQYAYFHVLPTSLKGQNNVDSGWNHFCCQPATTVITEDMKNNLVLLPGETTATPGVAAYGVKAPYDAVMTVYATCNVDIPLYPGKAGDTTETYSTRTSSVVYLIVGKNYNLLRQVGGFTLPDGYEKEVQTVGTSQTIFVPITQRGINKSPDCLAATIVKFSLSSNAQVVIVSTSAFVSEGDVISLSLFVEPPNDEDDYNVRQAVSNFQTQIGFTKAVPSSTGDVLLQALNPIPPAPVDGFVYSA